MLMIASYLGHGIVSFLWFHFSHTNNVSSICGKLSSKEEIDKVNLTDDINEVERLANEEADGVKVVVVDISGEIIDQQLFSFVFSFFSDDGAIEVEYKHFHLAGLPGLPQVAGNVEEKSLEKEDEANPLVVFMIFDWFVSFLRTNSRVRNILSNFFGCHPVGDGECRMDPAVRVHNIARHSFDDAVDGVANVLTGCNNQ